MLECSDDECIGFLEEAKTHEVSCGINGDDGTMTYMGRRESYVSGVANLRLFEGLFAALDECTRVPFSFLCYYIF